MPDTALNPRLKISLLRCVGMQQISQALSRELESYAWLLPASKKALILLKPNLNSYMNALTGNTTDLRVLVTVIEFLKNKGYDNLVIGEGTSSGFYREKINIFSRLFIDRLARFYGIKTLDLNYAPQEAIEFERGVKAYVARICREADFFINLPKIKTHFETGMSVCLKNMMGALVGLSNKQKAHRSLYRNIINLNAYLKPHLHIVDGLIGMEGNGPSSGTPVNLGVILVGTDPYLLDLACARLIGFSYEQVPYLKIAWDKGLIDESYISFVRNFIPESLIRKLRKPKVNMLVKIVNDPKWQHYIVRIRLAPGFRRIFSSRPVGKILNQSGLRQDVFVKTEQGIQNIVFDSSKCIKCNKCAQYCPMAIAMPKNLGQDENRCIRCMYCFFVCPQKALSLQGELGFLAEQIKKYDLLVRSAA